MCPIFGGVSAGTDISDADAVVADVKAPKTFYAVSGAKKTGTMPVATLSTAMVPTTSRQQIAAGYHAGTGNDAVAGESNLVAANVKSGVSIFGVTGNFEGPIAVAAGADDSSGTGGVYANNAGEQRMGNFSSSSAHSAYLFRGINIPAGKTITGAYMRFTSEYTRNNQITVHVRIKGEDAAVPAAYGATEDFTARTYLATVIDSDLANTWTQDLIYLSVSIVAIIAALYAKYGPYVNGVIALEVSDNGSTGNQVQIARSYDNDPTKAAMLFITYQ